MDNDLVIKLEELFEEVKTMVKMGDKNDALDLLEANYGAVKEQLDTGSRGIEEAAILDVVALGYMVIEDFKMVGSLLDMVIPFYNIYYYLSSFVCAHMHKICLFYACQCSLWTSFFLINFYLFFSE